MTFFQCTVSFDIAFSSIPVVATVVNDYNQPQDGHLNPRVPPVLLPPVATFSPTCTLPISDNVYHLTSLFSPPHNLFSLFIDQ